MVALNCSDDLIALAGQVRELREALLSAEEARADEIARTHPSHRRSAANLVHYVELRNHDIRELQTLLALMGMSSLGRSEPFVLATIEAVLSLINVVTDAPPFDGRASVALTEGHELLELNADRLLGPARLGRSTRIMVTMPGEAADDELLIERWIGSGMDVARVNCAHDDSQAWSRMIARVRSRAVANGRGCQVAMDLGGPKLRTGPLVAGPRAVRIRPRRDQRGVVEMPGWVRLSLFGRSPNVYPAHAAGRTIVDIPVDDSAWLGRRRPGDTIHLLDSRGAQRSWDVTEVDIDYCLASTEQTTYVETGLELECSTTTGSDIVTVGLLPETDEAHQVQRGDSVGRVPSVYT